MSLVITDVKGFVTTEFTRELLFLQVHNSDVFSGIRFSSDDFLTAETEPLVTVEQM